MYVTMLSISWKRNCYTRMRQRDNLACTLISPTHHILSSCHSSRISAVSHYGPTPPVSIVNRRTPCNNAHSTRTRTTSTRSAWPNTPVSTTPHHPSPTKTTTLKSSTHYAEHSH